MKTCKGNPRASPPAGIWQHRKIIFTGKKETWQRRKHRKCTQSEKPPNFWAWSRAIRLSALWVSTYASRLERKPSPLQISITDFPRSPLQARIFSSIVLGFPFILQAGRGSAHPARPVSSHSATKPITNENNYCFNAASLRIVARSGIAPDFPESGLQLPSGAFFVASSPFKKGRNCVVGHCPYLTLWITLTSTQR